MGLVFAALRDGADELRRAGIASATWLPLACDADIHCKHDVRKQYDIALVGHVFPGIRAELLTLIRRNYPRLFIGQCFFDEMARTYSAARLAFNRSIKNDVYMRVFEALRCRSLLLTNDLGDNGQPELFRDGVHLATYREPEDLLDKIVFYLGRESLREKIADAGRAEAIEKHTYEHRMEHVLLAAQAGTTTSMSVADPTSSSGPAAAPDFTYFGHARPEVVAMVPLTARAILDIGCGAGRLGAALKARQPAEVVGIELNEKAAAAARERIDQVFCGDIERLEFPLTAGRFDAIVCADVLEHLREPERVPLQARTWLAPDGCLIASIPNVQHHSVLSSLLRSNWTYESAGLLDQTHLRFFALDHEPIKPRVPGRGQPGDRGRHRQPDPAPQQRRYRDDRLVIPAAHGA